MSNGLFDIVLTEVLHQTQDLDNSRRPAFTIRVSISRRSRWIPSASCQPSSGAAAIRISYGRKRIGQPQVNEACKTLPFHSHAPRLSDLTIPGRNRDPMVCLAGPKRIVADRFGPLIVVV